MDKQFYSGNRRRLAERMTDNDTMLFFSGESLRKSADENFPFFTNRNFLYLTGIKQEQSALLFLKKCGLISECLFVTKPDREREIWTGRRFTEAGIYIGECGIGLRIEDNVLVTADGCENLSAAIPSTMEEIESLMATRKEKQ